MSRVRLKNYTSRVRKEVKGITVQNRKEEKHFYTLKTKAWKYSNMPEYQVQEYSNDGYDSGVRVKSGYILYIGLHSRR